nr:ATP-dependent helicase C-terminal domain-containing protein [Pseudomonas sp. VI4.1]
MVELRVQDSTSATRLKPSPVKVTCSKKPPPKAVFLCLSSSDQAPILTVRLQELFGLTETPRIAGGRQVVKRGSNRASKPAHPL